MNKQKICANCGLMNWSRWFRTCECVNPDFKYDSFEEYEYNQQLYSVYKGDDFYGTGRIDHINSLINSWLTDHMRKYDEVTFKIVKKERK
ncbi:hypothetical protein FLAPJACK_55 [Bacillus phage Flapjack]|uniref:Uncharacterized protein n=1 Tax=Bacillus phage Flapjack TaxID=1983465 RepID=A0A1X9SFZ1_9CAUD|nr:hypothetical protein FLAPJACK_55 [Bacillus phage Flapjack]